MTSRTCIGLVVPHDFVLDRECWELLPSHVDILITRQLRPSAAPTDDPLALAEAIADPAALEAAAAALRDSGPSAVAYGCTSGGFVGGPAREAELRAALTRGAGVPAVTTSSALIEACRALGVERLGVGTPYHAESGARLGARLVDFLGAAGIDVPVAVHRADVGPPATWTRHDVEQLAVTVAGSEPVDAVFLACTNLPTEGLLATLRARAGVPVIVANQVTIWATLRAAGIGPSLPMELTGDQGSLEAAT